MQIIGKFVRELNLINYKMNKSTIKHSCQRFHSLFFNHSCKITKNSNLITNLLWLEDDHLKMIHREVDYSFVCIIATTNLFYLKTLHADSLFSYNLNDLRRTKWIIKLSYVLYTHNNVVLYFINVIRDKKTPWVVEWVAHSCKSISSLC